MTLKRGSEALLLHGGKQEQTPGLLRQNPELLPAIPPKATRLSLLKELKQFPEIIPLLSTTVSNLNSV